MAKNDKAPKAKVMEPITLSYAPSTNPKKKRAIRAIIAATAIATGAGAGYLGTNKVILPRIEHAAKQMSDKRYDSKMQEVWKHEKNMEKSTSEYFKRLYTIADKLRVYHPGALNGDTLFPFERDDKDGRLRKAIENDPELNRLRLKIIEGDKRAHSPNYYPTYGNKPQNYDYPSYFVGKHANKIKIAGATAGAVAGFGGALAGAAALRWVRQRHQRRPTRK